MDYRHYSTRLGIRLVVLAGLLTVLVWLAITPGFYTSMLIVAGLIALMAAELWRFTSRTNRELARFLHAARHADFSQRFDLAELGTGFTELGEEFSAIMDRLHSERAGQEVEVRQLRALIEHIPVPLLTLRADDSITLENNAARRLFGAAAVTKLGDLGQFGGGFRDVVAEAVPGRRELVTFSVDDIDYQLTLAVTEISTAGRIDRLISLQDIQTELDATQTEAWQDLVRVLTHEMMNSITPVTSLATTAESLVEDALGKLDDPTALEADLADLQDAVGTVARRSASLNQFVDSYRQLTRLAPPEKKRIAIAELFESVATLARAETPDLHFELLTDVEPRGLDVFADRDLLEPVLLNIIRNARQATEGQANATIRLRARLNRRGNTVVEVADNGPGVPRDMAQKIFVPFFTTKASGSGVGLALARQVMTAHGGFIRLADTDAAGATFTLTF